jgi:hypothetical protein
MGWMCLSDQCWAFRVLENVCFVLLEVSEEVLVGVCEEA